MSESKQHWTAERTAYRPERDAQGFMALVYDPTPGGRKNADGSTSFSLRLPALVLTDIVANPEDIAKKLAVQLNAFDDMRDALRDLLSLIESIDAGENDDAPEIVAARLVLSKAGES